MLRRAMLSGLAASALSISAKAAEQVIGMTPAGPVKRAFVAQPQIVRQQCPEWCWAASSSMIFAMHVHPTDQKKIVARAYNNLVCASGPGIVVSAVLSSQWPDDMGRVFQSRVMAAYDYTMGINTVTNQLIVTELLANRPILYGNTHHAMVLFAVNYVDTPMGPNIVAADVIDPFPGMPPIHPLSQPELYPVHRGGQLGYMATVQVF